jgi:multidrug efflux pump subunit AcrA (membrane-fusion protein)
LGHYLVFLHTGILGLAELISYPDVVKTQLKIRTLSLPKPVTVSAPGKLIKLLVLNNQQVTTNQPLAIIESGTGKITLTAPQSGQLTYTGILHEDQEILANQRIFHINGNNDDFFGEMLIPQVSTGKVKDGQQVIIKLKNYPYQEYGMFHGKIKYIADNPLKDGEYIAEVDFKSKNITDMHKTLNIKQGMWADAEIITQNSSLLKRLTDNIFRNINHK